jgi:hypothetical protein
MSRRSLVWVLAALLGIALTAGITWASSQLTSQRIGLSSEPISAGVRLAPTVSTTSRRVVTRPSHTTTTTQRVVARPSQTTTTTLTVTTPAPAAPPPEAVPQTTTSSTSSREDGTRGRGGSGGSSARGRDD